MPSPTTPPTLSPLTLPLRRPCKSLRLTCSKLITFELLINFLFNFETCASLKLIMLEVPSPSYVGESVELSCIYELESDKLYSVKWYKNDVEFYRYVPKDWPPGQFLPINGIRVDLSKSGMNSVFLKYIDINTAGVYRCEVSAEAPSFVTAEGEKELQVTVLPLSGPQISGVQQFYKVGYEVNLNCTSAKSKPSAQIRWYLNNKEVTGDEYNLSNVSTIVHDDNLETSSRSLQFVALEKHFKSGTIRIKCTATVIRIHTMSNEAILRTESIREKNIDYYLSETLSQPSNQGSSHTSARCLLASHFFVILSLLSLMLSLRH